MLEVNQDPLCRQAQRLAKYGDIEVWGKRLEDGSMAVGLFNFGFEAAPCTLKWSDLSARGPQKVRDLWRQKDLGTQANGLDMNVERHGVVLLKLTPQPVGAKAALNEAYLKWDIQVAVKRFEGRERDVAKLQDKIVAACQLKPGMDVADIGAGTGLFTRLFAAKVGPQGKVYAVDITPGFIEHVKKTAEQQGLKNVVTILSKTTSAELPPGSVDLAFVCDTYHHFEYPAKMLASIRSGLRPGGQLIIIDRKKADEHVRRPEDSRRRGDGRGLQADRRDRPQQRGIPDPLPKVGQVS